MNREWYYVENGGNQGPISEDALREKLQQKILSPQTLIWTSGMPDWQPAFKAFVSPASPANQPPPPPLPGPASLKRIPFGLVILYNFITQGIYGPIWLLTRREGFNQMDSERKLNQPLLLLSLVLCSFYVATFISLSVVQANTSYSYANYNLVMCLLYLNWVQAILLLGAIVILLWQAFRARRILIDHLAHNGRPDIKVSWAGLLFLQNIYLQYKLNRVFLPAQEQSPYPGQA